MKGGASECQRVPAACAQDASGLPHDRVMTPPDLMIQAEGLRKRFGSTQALDGVDLAVPAGTVLGVLGPNGAGKTTAVRILATLLQADSGTALVGGYDVATQPHKVRRTIGLTGPTPRSTRTSPAPRTVCSSASCSASPRAMPGLAPRSCSSGSTSRTPRAGWPRPTAAVCVGRSTSRPGGQRIVVAPSDHDRLGDVDRDAPGPTTSSSPRTRTSTAVESVRRD